MIMERRKRLPAFLPLLLILLLFGGCAKPVTLYTDINRNAAEKLVEPFTKRTGIPVAVIMFNNPVDLANNIAVYDDGKYVEKDHLPLYNFADVVLSTDIMTGEVLKTRGLLLPYAPDEANSLPAGVKSDGWWYGTGGHVCVLAWNTDLYKGPAPAGLLDLAGLSFPEGAVAMINPNDLLYYYSGASAKLGRDVMVPFLQTMLDRKTQWSTYPADTAAKVAAGQATVCLTTLEEAEKQKMSGAPIAWAVPDQADGGIGAYLRYNTVSTPKVSRMPEQGRLLADYLLSPEAEALGVKLGLSDATLRPCGADAPVVRPLDTNLAAAQSAMQNELGSILTTFASAGTEKTGD